MLAPGVLVGRVGGAVPGKEAHAIVRRPAVRSRVPDVRLAIEIEGRGTLIDRGTVRFKVFGRLRDNGDVACQRGVVRSQLLDTEGLICDTVEA